MIFFLSAVRFRLLREWLKRLILPFAYRLGTAQYERYTLTLDDDLKGVSLELSPLERYEPLELYANPTSHIAAAPQPTRHFYCATTPKSDAAPFKDTGKNAI